MSTLSTPIKSDHSSTSSSADPFDDPASNPTAKSTSQQQQGTIPVDPSSILTVDRNVTLTIGEECMVLVDEGLKHRRDRRNCFGLFSRWTKTTLPIPFRCILWAELEDLTISIKYASSAGKICRLGHIQYTLAEKTTTAHATQWVQALMDRAYPAGIKRRKRIKVLINPCGGQGYAQKIWARDVEPLFAAAHCEVDVETTTHRGHAVDLAERLDTSAFDVIAAASGDGLPHEIFNGLAKQKKPRSALYGLAVTQIPCGSGNALSLNTLGTAVPSWAALEIVKGLSAPLDLMAVTQGNEKFYSFLSQAVGIVAESDLGTESLRWMGALRFQWGVLVRLFGKTVYPAEISIATETRDKDQIVQLAKLGHEKQKTAWKDREAECHETELPPFRYGTVNDPMPPEFETVDHPDLGNFYTGNMPIMAVDTTFFRNALLKDGLADLITISGLVPRTVAIRMLTSVETGGIFDFPEVDYRKVHGYRIVPRMDVKTTEGRQSLRWRLTQWLGGAGGQTEGLVAIDGERMPFQPFQVEVHQGLGTILYRSEELFGKTRS